MSRINPSLVRSLGSFFFVLAVSLGEGSIRAQSWSPTAAPATNWVGVASSADGTKIVAIPGATPVIYRSTNSGLAWEPIPTPSEFWSISCSADGQRLIAAANNVYLSEDAGNTWNVATDSGVHGVCAALSADGNRLVVVDYSGAIYVSTNSGSSWTQTQSPSVNSPWTTAASSADGTTFMAAGSAGYHGVVGKVAISTNCGATWWTADLPGDTGWRCAAVSADGSKLVVAAGSGSDSAPWIYISADRGLTWTAAGAPLLRWTSLTASADGMTIAAAGGETSSSIYVSTNGGGTWATPGAPVASWSSLAYSADGTQLLAAAGPGSIYRYNTAPAPPLRVTSSGAGLSLSWLTPSISFVLQQTTSLAQPDWAGVDAQPALNYTNLNQEVHVPAPSKPMFYRLVSR